MGCFIENLRGRSQTPSSGRSETEGEGEVVVGSKDADICTRKGPDVLLNIHNQLDLVRLQQV